MDDFLLPDWPAPSRVRALVTTRQGGASRRPYAGFNLATHVGDDPIAVAANRQYLHDRLAVTPLWLSQVHGTHCVMAEDAEPDVQADACITRSTTRACAVLTADCLPVFFCDQAGTVVGVAHAGWRGLLHGVLEATINAMGQPSANLLAWLGPAIGPAAFEVGDEVREAFLVRDFRAAEAFIRAQPGKWYCDIYALARLRLEQARVAQVYGGGLCTVSDPERFYSYRRDGVTGRMASLIWIEKGIP